MQRSHGRIFTTHTGSLPRTSDLTHMMVLLSRREELNRAAFERDVEASTRRVIHAQLDAGIDVGNDGEQSRESFFTYVQHRLSGYGGESARPVMRDIVRYPTFRALKAPDFSREMVNLGRAPMAIGEVRHVDTAPIEREVGEFARLVAEDKRGFLETFMTAASPGIVAAAMLNAHYANDDDYVLAVAEALRPEYQHIVSQGLVLQVDCPDLAMERHTSYADRPLADFLRYVERNIAALNHAIAGLPRDRLRMHVCWGNYEAPHDLDVPMEEILPLLYAANVGAIVLPFANPRHAHEWRCIERHPLPDGWLLVAGVIDTTTNYVEHPQVVADRIEQVARAVGDPERVLAGTDCGFATSAGLGEVAEEVVWQKLRSLTAGAAIASEHLFR